MPYPICGKCGSRNVYSDRDERGARVVCCLMCGNRQPGAGKGFYMSDKPNFKEAQTGSAGAPDAKKQDVFSADRICSACKLKKTISPKHDLCGSCMAAKANQKRGKSQKLTGKGIKQEKTEGKRSISGINTDIKNMNVIIDFSDYPAVLNQLKKLADEQIRPIEAQIMFLLKKHFSGPRMSQ